MRNRRIGTVAVATLLVVLAACGGDDGATVRDLGADGSASASGSASGSSSGSASGPAPSTSGTSEADGGYDYVSDVSSHRLVVVDICEINELLDTDPIDFEAVGNIYRDGKNSVKADGSVRTLAGFASDPEGYPVLASYFGSETPLDDFVTDAIDGTGIFSGASEDVRRQGVQKGVQNQIMVAWTVAELDSALAKAEDGNWDPSSGAVHSWDEAWAFYHGSQAGCAPYATADKRGDNFGTMADETTSVANAAILKAMNDGREALEAEDIAVAESAADEVRRYLFVTYSQAAVRYASVAAADVADGNADDAAVHQAEGYAFWRVIEAQAAAAGADVDAVNAILAIGTEPGVNGGGDEVTEALAPAWEAWGITPEDIGALD